MSLAIGIGVMLLGGWVLEVPSDNQLEQGQQGEQGTAQPGPSPSAPGLNPSAPAPGPGGEGGYGTPNGPGQGQQSNAGKSPRRGGSVVPMAPTDPSLKGPTGLGGMPLPPTQVPLDSLGTGSGAAGQMPAPPTMYRRPFAGAQSSASSYSQAMALQQQRLAPPGSAAPTAPMAPEKAFSGPSPYVSPGASSAYMNLFRSGNAGGTIDNYTTLVRPQLQQQGINQQFIGESFERDRQYRIQQMLLQRGQYYNNPRILQGIGTPQYQVNYGTYHPAFGGVGSYYGPAYNGQGFVPSYGYGYGPGNGYGQ